MAKKFLNHLTLRMRACWQRLYGSARVDVYFNLEFQSQNFFFLHCILLITKVKVFQGRNLIVVLLKKFFNHLTLRTRACWQRLYDSMDACVHNVYISNNYLDSHWCYNYDKWKLIRNLCKIHLQKCRSEKHSLTHPMSRLQVSNLLNFLSLIGQQEFVEGRLHSLHIFFYQLNVTYIN